MGENANFKEEYLILNIEKKIAYVFIYTGAAFILVAGLAWSAYAARSEFVTYCVRRRLQCFTDYYCSLDM